MKIKSLQEYILSNVDFYIYDNENFLEFLDDIGFVLEVPFIHVTGTAGKTAIVNLLANIYKENSYKVDSVTSDEFLDYKNLDLEKYPGFAVIFEKYWKKINKYELTIYEVLFFCKLVSFNERKLDLVIIEAFKGGLLDTSNINQNSLMVILNNAGLEHCDELGKSASEIALSKCGVIKNESLVLLNSFDSDIEYVLVEECKKTRSKLIKVNEFYNYDIKGLNQLTIQYHQYPSFKVNTTALYNRENVACVLEAVSLLANKYPTTNEGIQKGLLCDIGLGYSSVFKYKNKNIILDKANNPFSIEKLCKSLIFSIDNAQENTAILFAVEYNKNIEKMLSVVSRISSNILLTTFDDENARKEDGFFLFLDDYNYIEDFKAGLDKLVEMEGIENILVTGNEKFVKIVSCFLGEIDA